MREDACPYQKLTEQQVEELLQMAVWSLNEIGLRKLTMTFLGAMTQAGTSGRSLGEVLAEQPTDPIVNEVLHLQRHAMAKRAEQGHHPHLHAVAN